MRPEVNSNRFEISNRFEKSFPSHGNFTTVSKGGLNKKETQLNLCNIFSIFIFNRLYLFTE